MPDVTRGVGHHALQEAAERWATALGAWAIPEPILEQAPVSPWAHDTATFAVDDTVDRDVLSARVARDVLPPRGGSVLDVGCGGGRSAVSLVPPAERLIGVDQSPAMLAEFVRAAEAAGARAETVEGRWPDIAERCPVADVVTCHHVAYNVADIVPFVEALTTHAALAVVLVLPTRHPQSPWNGAWRHFWDLERPSGPTDRDLSAVLAALGLDVERWEMPRPTPSRHATDPESQVPALRRRLCLPAERDDDVRRYLAEHEPDWVDTHVVLRWPGTGAG